MRKAIAPSRRRTARKRSRSSSRAEFRPDMCIVDYNLAERADRRSGDGAPASDARPSRARARPDGRYFDRHPQRDRPPALRPPQQADQGRGARSHRPAAPGQIEAEPPAGAGPPPGAASRARQQTTVFVVDDDGAVREAIRDLLSGGGTSGRDLSPAAKNSSMPIVPASRGCLLVDARMPGMSGLDACSDSSRRKADFRRS